MSLISFFSRSTNKKALFALSLTIASFSSNAQQTESPSRQQTTIAPPASGSEMWQQSRTDGIATPSKKGEPAAATHDGNFTSFLPVSTERSSEVMLNNKGFEDDAELGVLYPNAPCSDCYELLGKRTATQKYFVKKGTNTTQFILQSNNLPVHYRDENGRWRTVNNHLENAGSGVYGTKGRTAETIVNTNEGSTTLSCAGGSLSYNQNLELIYIKADGSEQSLGSANWHKHSQGEDGMKVENAWPGIDIEISVLPNSLKTNFVINHPLAAFTDGKLVIRDHMQPAKGLQILQENDKLPGSELKITNTQGETIFTVSKAVAYERHNTAVPSASLNYKVAGNEVDIEVPGSLLNKPLSSYPLVIDPLVSGTITAGFTYSGILGEYSCANTNNVLIPAGATLSDIRLTYSYRGVLGADFSDAGVEYAVNGGCGTGILSCSGACGGFSSTAAACGMTATSFWDGSYASWGTTAGCLPAFSCSAYTLPFEVYASQYYSSTPSCSQDVFATASGFTVDVYGTVPAIPSITSSGTGILCLPSTLVLTGTPSGGTWSSTSPGVGTVSSSGVVTGIVPGVTTIGYSTTGACGTTTANEVVTVKNPPTVGPVSGTSVFCQGTSVTLSDTSTGGVWSSSAASIATVNSIGSTAGLAGGSATISYTINNGCGIVYATEEVTINPLPVVGPIIGPSGVCIGDTILLSDTTSGGVWTSSMTGVASINSSGVVAGLTTGTTTVTYAVTNSCGTESATTSAVVALTPTVDSISGVTSVCEGSVITLSDATTGSTWVSSMPGVATVDSTGKVTGISGGTAVISYENSSACATAVATKTVTVSPLYTGVYVISTIAGNGTAGYSGDGGAPTSAEINDVYGIGVNPEGQIYLADYGNSVIRGIGGGEIVTVLTDTYSPIIGVAADHFGNVYATELTTGRILKCNATSTTAFLNELEYPTGICTDKYGNVYVAAQLGYGIYEFDSTGTLLTSGSVSTPGEATGVAIDTAGNLYFSCWNMEYVWRQDHITGAVTIIAGNGTAGFSGDGGPATDAEINQPYSIATDQAGNVYIADVSNYRIRKVEINTGIITTIAGTGSSLYNGDNIPALAANIAPNDVFVDASGNVLISDAGNNRIRKITSVVPAIMGTPTVCIGGTVTLSDTAYGGSGVWSSGNPLVASVNAAGVVTGLSSGFTNISYTLSNSCSSEHVSFSIHVEGLANTGIISGPSSLCRDSSITLTDVITGGIWGSISGNVTVSGSGVVTGITAGIDTVTYSVTNICGTGKSKHPVVINNCSLGVNSIMQENGNINVFPNPNYGKFTINVPSGAMDDVSIEIKNMLGETVGKCMITANKDTEITLDQPPGIYLLTAFTSEKTYSARVTIMRQ